MHKLNLLLILSIGLLAMPQLVHGQQTLSLDEAVHLAQQNNRSVLQSHQSIQVHKASYEQSKGAFLPHIGVQASDVLTNNPLNVFGFKLLHEDVTQADFNPEVLNSPDVLNHYNLTLHAMMPIYNQEARANQEVIQDQIRMSESMAQRTVQGVEMEVVKRYYTLVLAQRATQVLAETHQSAQANYAVADRYFAEGLLLKSDLLDMQVTVSQSKLAWQSAQMNVLNAQSHLNYVMGSDPTTTYILVDSLPGIETSALAPADSLNTMRADFQAMHHGIHALQSSAKANDKSFLPKVSGFAGFELNDDIPFASRANNFQVGVTLGWDIYKGNRRKTTKNKIKAEIAEKKLELETNIANAELEIVIVRRELNHLMAQLKVQDELISQSQAALNIRKNRFAQGLEKSTDIINSEALLSQKKLQKLQTVFQLSVQRAYLDFLLK